MKKTAKEILDMWEKEQQPKDNTHVDKEGFTGGEWKVRKSEVPYELSIVSSDGWHISTINPYSPENQNAEANAALIAASPDLLRALIEARQFIIDNIDVLPDSHDIRLKALIAINKANPKP